MTVCTSTGNNKELLIPMATLTSVIIPFLYMYRTRSTTINSFKGYIPAYKASPMLTKNVQISNTNLSTDLTRPIEDFPTEHTSNISRFCFNKSISTMIYDELGKSYILSVYFRMKDYLTWEVITRISGNGYKSQHIETIQAIPQKNISISTSFKVNFKDNKIKIDLVEFTQKRGYSCLGSVSKDGISVKDMVFGASNIKLKAKL